MIIEPTGNEKTKEGDAEAGSSRSKSRSRSGTPSGRISVKPEGAQQPTALAQPGTAGPLSGSPSYYRQNAGPGAGADVLLFSSNTEQKRTQMSSNTTAYTIPPPPPPGAPLDPQYAQSPASTARIHQGGWPPPPWPADGTVPAMGQIPHLAYQVAAGPAIYYQPSPYYRPTPGMLPPHAQLPHQPQINPDLGQELQNGGSSNDAGPSAATAAAAHDGSPPHSVVVDPQLSQPDSSPVQRSMTIDANDTPVPVIDPSLDASSEADDGGAPSDDEGLDMDMDMDAAAAPDHISALSLKITQAAMEAVLESARQGEGSLVEAAARHSGSPPHPLNVDDGLSAKDADGYCDGQVEGDADLIATGLIADEDFHRSEPLDHMLTEDGEPMLHPGQSSF